MATLGTDLLIIERAGVKYKTTVAEAAKTAITVSTTAPVSPAVGDLWVDTN